MAKTALKWVWSADFRSMWETKGHYKLTHPVQHTPERNGCRWNMHETVCLLAGFHWEGLSIGALAHRHQRGQNAIGWQLERSVENVPHLLGLLRQHNLLTRVNAYSPAEVNRLLELRPKPEDYSAYSKLLTSIERQENPMNPTPNPLQTMQFAHYASEANLQAVRQAVADQKPIEYAHVSTMSSSKGPMWGLYEPTTNVGLLHPAYAWRVKPERITAVEYVGVDKDGWLYHDRTPGIAPNVAYIFEDGQLVKVELR